MTPILGIVSIGQTPRPDLSEAFGADLDLIVIDCMGHADAARRAMAQWTGRPVIAAQSLVARVAGALV